MERKRKEESIKPRWKKTTRGNLYPYSDRKNIRVKQNETISASKEELEKYLDHFEMVKDGTGEYRVNQLPGKPNPFKPKTAKPTAVGKEQFTLKSAGADLFDVVSVAGKVMNDLPLDAEAAGKLKTALDAGETEQV